MVVLLCYLFFNVLTVQSGLDMLHSNIGLVLELQGEAAASVDVSCTRLTSLGFIGQQPQHHIFAIVQILSIL